MTSCVRGGGGVSKKLTKPDKGGRGGQPKTDEVDFLLNKKLLLCSIHFEGREFPGTGRDKE